MATPRAPFDLRTQVDRELEGVPRGAELAAQVAGHRMLRNGPQVATVATGKGMTWGDFQQRHPEWMGLFWEECRALYAGGPRLLQDPAVLQRLFPSHNAEERGVYAERQRRAHYYPYAGTIIDQLLAGLGTDQLRPTFAEIDADKGTRTLAGEAEWWERWLSDVTDSAERPSDYGLEDDNEEDDDEGGTTIHSFLVDALREALQTRAAWVLAELPEYNPEIAETIDSEAARLESGVDDPYLCLVPAEQVIDWKLDHKGRVEWAITMTQEQVRDSPTSRRDAAIRHTFVVWDQYTWTKYQIDVKTGEVLSEGHAVPIVEGPVDHGFPRAPFERLVLPEGLHAMGKLHSLAREHLNKRCAMSWAEYKSLFSQLYEFVGADENGGDAPTISLDPNRAVNQVRGQGYTQVRGSNDSAMYVGPDPAVFTAARESCNDAMREMHRVMFSMAQSADMDKGALKRSGESKAQDNAATAVLLDAFGQILRRFFRRVLVLAAIGRGEAPPRCTVEGLEQFDVSGTADAIKEAVEFFNGVPILSATVRELALARIYEKMVPDMTPEQRKAMREEIKEGISAEQLAIEGGMLPGVAPGTSPTNADKAVIPDDEEEDDDEDPGVPRDKERPGFTSKPRRRG